MNTIDRSNDAEIALANAEGRDFLASLNASTPAWMVTIASEMLLKEYAAKLAADDAANDLADQAADALDDLADAYTNRAPQAPGMYEFGGVAYAVVLTKDGTNLYAKRLITAPGTKPTYAYAPGMMAMLKESMKMSAERGVELSGEIGACCVCARTLTVKKSIAAGIGPKCAKMF